MSNSGSRRRADQLTCEHRLSMTHLPSSSLRHRWPPLAQRTHQAADHRGVPRVAARQPADADGGADRRAGRLFCALDLRALPRSQYAARRGDRLQPRAGARARARRAMSTATVRRGSSPRSRRAPTLASAASRCGACCFSSPTRTKTGALKPRVAPAARRPSSAWRSCTGRASTLPEEDRKPLLIALEAITDIESWARMREQFTACRSRKRAACGPRHRPPAAADAGRDSAAADR